MEEQDHDEENHSLSVNKNPVTTSSSSSSSRSLPEIISAELSEEECLTRMRAVLQGRETTLPAKHVQDAWSSYLEMLVEPAGWRALLIPSEDTASVVKREAGTRGAMVVEVVDILFDSLEAEVECLDEDLKNKIVTVAADELYPVKHQEYESLNIETTASALDLFRFFYKNVWMPWDEDSECHDWPGQHLQYRLHLHFSLTTGAGDQDTAARLDELCARAELNRTELLELEDLVNTGEESVEGGEVSYQVLGKMYKLHQEQESIRREAEMLENPTLRHAVSVETRLVRKQSRLISSASILLVWTGGSLNTFTDITDQLRAEFGDQNLMTYPDLQHALDCSVKDDVVVVTRPGEHVIRHLGALATGGRIMALGCPEASVTIVPGDTDSVFLAVSEGKLELTNIMVDLKNVNIGVMVSSADLVLDHVRVVGGQTAVLVGQQGKLVVDHGKVSESGIAVKISAGAGDCVLDHCVIDKNRIGVNVAETGACHVRNCYIGKNEEYGVLLHCADTGEAGVWSGEQGVVKARQRGVVISNTEFGKNRLADVGIFSLETVEQNSPSRPHHNIRRFSTPMSGKSVQTPGCLDSRDSPIFPSLSRILTYPDQ